MPGMIENLLSGQFIFGSQYQALMEMSGFEDGVLV